MLALPDESFASAAAPGEILFRSARFLSGLEDRRDEVRGRFLAMDGYVGKGTAGWRSDCRTTIASQVPRFRTVSTRTAALYGSTDNSSSNETAKHDIERAPGRVRIMGQPSRN